MESGERLPLNMKYYDVLSIYQYLKRHSMRNSMICCISLQTSKSIHKKKVSPYLCSLAIQLIVHY